MSADTANQPAPGAHAMAMYESEHTKFMREWMEKHP